MNNIWPVAVTAVVAVAVAGASPGFASADNNNTNTNNNDATNVGDPSDSFAPSSDSADWPPIDFGNGGRENGGAAATPIVIPTP
jgi:hypothetical protein